LVAVGRRAPASHRVEPRAGDPREAAPHYEENMKMFGELRLVRASTDEQIEAMCAGRPEDIIEQFKAVEKRYPGLDPVICATPLGTPLDAQLADLDRFAHEVIPAFRDTKLAAAAQ
jgi:hypothetical protein